MYLYINIHYMAYMYTYRPESVLVELPVEGNRSLYIELYVKRSTGHTHTHRQRTDIRDT